MQWCLTHIITGVPPSVSVALKITLRSLEHHGIYIKFAVLNSKVIFLKKIVTHEKYVKVLLSDFSSGFSPAFYSLFLISIQSSCKNLTNTNGENETHLFYPQLLAIDQKTPLTMISIPIPNFLKSCNT